MASSELSTSVVGGDLGADQPTSAHAGRVRAVLLHTGQRLDADVVVLATGTQPNLEWSEAAA